FAGSGRSPGACRSHPQRPSRRRLLAPRPPHRSALSMAARLEPRTGRSGGLARQARSRPSGRPVGAAMKARVFAPAKINLALQVGRPRADGLHPLQSVVAFADVGDWIEAEAQPDSPIHIRGPFARDLLQANGNLV